ncbi:MAG: hypothetical protein KDB27_19870 [Planctomycetales bacterium]|nr:hypothetical protein [Planctomycetales bacterium]
MRRLLAVTAILVATIATSAVADSRDRGANWHNANRSWHNNYYRADWGHPVAVIVPPTVNWQTNYAWGVGRNRVTPIHFQFGRAYVDPVTGTVTNPAPVWPYDTSMMGSYYVRGPW